MVKKKWWIISGIVLVILLAGLFFFLDGRFSRTEDFSKTSLIKMNIPVGGEINTSVKLTNPERNVETLKISLNNFKGLATLSDEEITIASKESKEIIISFSDGKMVPRVYVGKLIIENSLIKEEIPIILGVEDPDRAFAIIQTGIPKYDMVYPGGKLGLEFKVFDLVSSDVPTVKSTYVIKNLDDETILNGNTDLIVGTGSKTEIINVPKEWAFGDYVLISYIEYKDTLSFSSYLFSVSNPPANSFWGGSNLFLIGIVLFVVLILVMVIYFVKTRDSLLVHLRNQQEAEIKRSINYIKCSRESIAKSEEKPEKKKIKLKKLRKIEKKILKKIKVKQKKQKKEIKKLRKKKVKKDALHERLKKWENEGYRMYETGDEIKKITNKGIKEQVKEWKTRGYDTSFLNK